MSAREGKSSSAAGVGPPDLAARLAATIRDVADFPRPGVLFKDITPVLLDVELFGAVVAALAATWREERVTHVLALESRGFLFGAPVAMALGAAIVPARKPNKLPYHRVVERYELEYGSDALEVHRDAFGKGARVLIVDDLLATGGTAAAAVRIVRRLEAEVVGVSAVVELSFLPWRTALADVRVRTLISFT